MTDLAETRYRIPSNKKKLSITMSQDTYCMLKEELDNMNKNYKMMSMSTLIDAICYMEMVKQKQQMH